MKTNAIQLTRAPSNQAGFQTWTLIAIVAAVGGLAWYATGPGHWFREKPKEVLAGAPVQHGPLRISVIERGNLKAADSVSVQSGIEGQATILFLIPEGTLVKEGDLLCELDATSLVDKRFQQKISASNADAAYVKSQQNYEIQKSQNDSDIAKAEQKLLFAQKDQQKFEAEQGERTNQLAKAEEQITLADEKYKQAESRYGWSKQLFDKGFLTKTDLDADELSLKSAGIQRDAAVRDKELLKTYQLERTRIELDSGLEEAGRELDRVKLQAKAHIVDYENDMNTKKAQLELETEKLQRLENQIAKAKIHAPRAGMAVYAQEEGGMRYGNSQPMKEGAQVRERQEIITIPNAGGMIAQVSLHESVLKQVQAGQNCVIKVDAIGGHEFHGNVSYVAVLPDQNSWFANPNTRLYRTEVAITDGIADMRPGMSCQIEILVEDIPEATYAPVQCVFRNGSDNIAFVVHGTDPVEQRKVEIGKYNERWVQLMSGVKEGEILAMAAPSDFTPEPAKETPIDPNTPPPPGAMPLDPGSKNQGGRGPGGDGPQRSGRGGATADGAGDKSGGQNAAGQGRGSMTDEQRAEFQKRMANMSEEEKAKAMEEFRNKRRGAGGTPGGGAPGGGDASKSSESADQGKGGKRNP
jgi:HlyD family secretion protein